jgi:hypothetical protein
VQWTRGGQLIETHRRMVQRRQYDGLPSAHGRALPTYSSFSSVVKPGDCIVCWFDDYVGKSGATSAQMQSLTGIRLGCEKPSKVSNQREQPRHARWQRHRDTATSKRPQ